ncbi:MAG: nucleotidyl transferase AbiEii/AbiGii toxin family protein [Armatimonadetes bacterium]|nr:nucleotidyl transferase AbiEii/AbiGii toxin family protein [Armatimonadota bacterium]
MLDHLRQLADDAPDESARRGLVREYLQARTLQAVQDDGVFTRWAFIGGTALRFLFDLPRSSEDLDFSLLRPGMDPGLPAAAERIRQVFTREHYPVEVRAEESRTVAQAQIRFAGLLHQLGLSPHASQVLFIKLEVDTNPPAGAGIATTIVRRHVTLSLCHYDRASLLAGKLHAILSRPWTKGRDLYDLAWYLADRSWPAPNLPLLNAALAQTHWAGPALTEDNWRDQVSARLATVSWDEARRDIQPFLDRPGDLDLVSAETLASLLRPPR